MTNRESLLLKISEKVKGYEGTTITLKCIGVGDNPTIRVDNGNMFIKFIPDCKESLINLEYASESTLTVLLEDLNNPINVEYKKKDDTNDAEI